MTTFLMLDTLKPQQLNRFFFLTFKPYVTGCCNFLVRDLKKMVKHITQNSFISFHLVAEMHSNMCNVLPHRQEPGTVCVLLSGNTALLFSWLQMVISISPFKKWLSLEFNRRKQLKLFRWLVKWVRKHDGCFLFL